MKKEEALKKVKGYLTDYISADCYDEVEEIMEALEQEPAHDKQEKTRLRTKEEQKAYLDGFERCAESVEKYLSDEGKNILECHLTAVRSAVETKGSQTD